MSSKVTSINCLALCFFYSTSLCSPMVFSKTFWKDPLNVAHLGTRRMAVTDFQYLRQFLTQGPFCPSVNSTSSLQQILSRCPLGALIKICVCVRQRDLLPSLNCKFTRAMSHPLCSLAVTANDPPVLGESEMTSPGNFE